MSNTGAAYSGCSESEPFALQVLGDDMQPEFPDGCIIIGEPNAVVVDGCYVIALIDGEYLFRQLHIQGEPEVWYLSTLKKKAVYVQISGPEAIRARVVQSSNGKRSTRKFYV